MKIPVYYKREIYCSYRVEQAMEIPFQSSGLLKELKIHKKLVHAIDIQRKGME